MTDQNKTPPLAIWSLVLGILSLLCMGPLAAIPAVICGHKALGRIKQAAGAPPGHGMALAGLILGYVSIGLMIVVLPIWAALMVPAINKARDRAYAVQCQSNLRQIESVKMQLSLERNLADGTSVTLADLDANGGGMLGQLKCPRGGDYAVGAVGEEPRCSVHGSRSEPLLRR